MAEEISTPEPNLTDLKADLDKNVNTLDFSGLTLPDDQFLAKPEAIDIYKKNVGNPVTGTNPGKKEVGLNTLDFSKDLAQTANKEVNTSEDPYIKMRPFTYSGDYDGANFDRYYGTKAYKTLGFSPYRDNDALYNQKMTFGDQFVRAAGQWDNLMATGFMSGVKTWGTMFTDPLAPDLDSARDMKRSMARGNISTGGIGGFVGNTFLNSAYSIGIGLEFLAEEAALAAATAFTGGLAGEATLPAMAARGGMLGKQLGKLGELGAKVAGKTDQFALSAERAGEFAKIAAETSGGTKISSARQFFNKAASGAFDLVTPFESTATALKSSRYANDLAKTVGTAGAFMDDIIRIKTAASEAKLEGGMVKIDATEKLIDQYRELHGKDPEGEDLKHIEDLSSIEARRTTLYNFPAILTSNKLLFSTILYPLSKVTGTASTRVLHDLVAEGGMKALVENPFKVVGKTAGAQLKAAIKSIAKPSLYGNYGMNYLKANIGEGLQENIQEAISQGAIEHALAFQKDPGTASYRGYMGYLMDGMKAQVSAQGAETFASGLVMGAFTQPIMSAPAWAMAKGVEKFKNADERKAAKEARDEATLAEQTTLNEMANNDIHYWAPDLATAVKNGSLSNDLTHAASIGDEKAARDAKFRIEFNQMATAINSGKFEDLMDKLADYKNLTPEEALEAFQRYGIGINTKEDAAKALDHIDGVIERARSIKDQYEKVAQEFPNPYNLSGLKQDTPEYKAMGNAYMAWQEAQRNLVFAQSEFKNYSDRLGSMTDAFSQISSGIAQADTQSLLATTSLPSLGREIVTLQQELRALGDLEGTGTVRKEKQRSLELLQEFREKVIEAQENISDKDIRDYLKKKEVYQDAKKVYQKYLGHVAKRSGTILFDKTADDAFNMLTDMLEMRDEQHKLARSINVLNNPKGFLTLQKRLEDAFGEDRLNRDKVIAENLKNFQTMQDENNILEKFGKMGIKIPEDFLAEYKEALKAGKKLPAPKKFTDPSTQSDITEESNPEKFEEAMRLWNNFRAWMELNHEIVEEEEERPLEEFEEDKKAIQVYNTYDQALQDSLTYLYNEARKSGAIKDTVTLGEFIRTNDEAKLAIMVDKSNKNFTKAQEEADKKNPQTNWNDVISKAFTRRELDKIIDQIDAANAMTPELVDAISNKRSSLAKPVEEIEESFEEKVINDQIKDLQVQLKDIRGNSLGFGSHEIRSVRYTEKGTKVEFTGKQRDKYHRGSEKFLINDKTSLSVDYKQRPSKGWSDSREIPFDANYLENPVPILQQIAELKKQLEELKNPAAPIEEEIVRPDINPAFEGKILFVSPMKPGFGKEQLSTDNKDVINVDDLILETVRELNPDVKWFEDTPFHKNLYEAIRNQGVNREKLYNIVRNKMKEAAFKGKTVITSSPELMDICDFIMHIDPQSEFAAEKYDPMREVTESEKIQESKKTPVIVITEDISTAIKKSPMELLGIVPEIAGEETTITEPTLAEINLNLTNNNLQIAQDKGYDAVYKNNRYAITKVEQNSVTLKAIDGSVIEVKPEEISAVTEAEVVVTTPEENNDFKGVISTKTFDVNDAVDNLDDAAKNIEDNIC